MDNNKTKNNFLKIISAAKIFLMITVLIIIAFTLKCCAVYASEKALDKYNNSLSKNLETIEYCKNIQEQKKRKTYIIICKTLEY